MKETIHNVAVDVNSCPLRVPGILRPTFRHNNQLVQTLFIPDLTDVLFF